MLHLIITSESTSGSAVKEKKRRIDEQAVTELKDNFTQAIDDVGRYALRD